MKGERRPERIRLSAKESLARMADFEKRRDRFVATIKTTRRSKDEDDSLYG